MLKSINKSIEMEAATDQSATANIHHHLMTTFGRAFWTTDITFGQKHGLNPPILLRTLVFLHIAITRSGISALMSGGKMYDVRLMSFIVTKKSTTKSEEGDKI
jgi:hypothetical protein